MTELFNWGGTGINGDGNSFLFELLYLLLKYRLSWKSVQWRAGWMLTNQGQLRWIDEWIIQWRRNIYHRKWKFVALWVTVLAIKAPVITRSSLLPTLIVPCSNFVAITNNVWTWHDECNVSLWCCCEPVLFCWWPWKGESQIFGATTSVMFKFQYQE